MQQHHIIELPKGAEREKRKENIFEEITGGNFPNTGKETATQVQEAQSLIQDRCKEKHAKTH